MEKHFIETPGPVYVNAELIASVKEVGAERTRVVFTETVDDEPLVITVSLSVDELRERLKEALK